MNNIQVRNSKRYCLLFILLGGLLLRLFSLNSGLPYLFGPDETRQILDSLSMASRKSLVPIEYTYPALHKYLLLITFGVYFIAGVIVRLFSSVDDFTLKFFKDPGNIFLLGRILSVIFGLLIMIPSYLAGRRLHSPGAGVIAALFSVFMFSLTAHSQWATADIMLAFLSAMAFYYILGYVKDERPRDLLLAGMFIGLASATKYQGMYLLAPLCAAVMLNLFRVGNKRLVFKSTVLALVIISIFVIIGNLSFIFKFKESLQRLIEIKDETMGISSLAPFQNSYLSVSAWFIKELIRQETLLGITLVLGIFYSLYRHCRQDLVFLAYLGFCLFSIVGFGFRSLHILVYTFPVICVFAARFLSEMSEFLLKGKYRFSYPFLAAVAIVIPSVNQAVIWDIKRSNPDTRILARDWVYQNIPLGTKIAEDWYDFSVPLNSDVPLLFRDEKLKNAYMQGFSEGFRNRYLEYSDIKGRYDLLQVRYEAAQPFWPEDMPADARFQAESIPLVKRLYRWFNFRSLNELKEAGVKYIIISSYAYNHFLLDDDPRKSSGLFNPYMLEDTLSSNRQAVEYHPGSRHGLLFYLAKRARDFYLPLLDMQDENLQLVKTIVPGNMNCGPEIRIFILK